MISTKKKPKVLIQFLKEMKNKRKSRKEMKIEKKIHVKNHEEK